MSYRNLSPQRMFEQWALEHKPEASFKGRTPAEFRRWKAAAWPRVRATLGEFPRRVPPNPRLLAEWEHDSLRKQRWLLDVGPHISATLQVNYPGDLRRGEKRPAIQCWHGHGVFGKETVMGNDSSPEMREAIQRFNYSYGHQMAEAGFITYAIDWIGKGDRDDTRKPNHRADAGGRDWCNLYYLHATMLGTTPLAICLEHGRAATDFVCGLPFVDARRLGVMGLSGGGTLTLWSALCDPRFKAIEIICYSDLWAHFGFRDLNYCGMQVTPGLFRLVHLHDLQGLLAPRPLLVDIGVYDSCFLVDTALECQRGLERIYRAAGAAGRLELDLAPVEHSWPNRKSLPFFRKYLGGRSA